MDPKHKELALRAPYGKAHSWESKLESTALDESEETTSEPRWPRELTLRLLL